LEQIETWPDTGLPLMDGFNAYDELIGQEMRAIGVIMKRAG
jgi:hypothetical protein